MKIGMFVLLQRSQSYFTHLVLYTVSLSALTLFLVAACLCLTESRSHGNTKLNTNTLIERLEKAWTSLFEGEVALTADDCDYDHKCYDHCCPHKASVNGTNWICCDPKWLPTVCATSKEACMS